MTSTIEGMVMVYIPAGEFVMGEDSQGSSGPQHIVYLDAYWIGQTEVTNAMFAQCVQAKKCAFFVQDAATEVHYADPAYANHPVVYISWFDAAQYCKWVKGRLPTEAEWEKAARGIDGRMYPWGNAEPDPTLLNFNNQVGDTTPVGSYPSGASPYGALDMAGNVREWLADWFRVVFYRFSPDRNPLGPPSGDKRVLRGGAFDDPANAVRVVRRLSHDPKSAGVNRGFRCVRAPEGE